MEPTEKKPAPPYVAYRTLSNFVDRFKQGLPGRIDRGLMASMSGAAQSQVTTALRYLGMISEHGIPTLLMRQYATGEEAERKDALRKILEASYPFLFDGVFNLSHATQSMLREVFEANTSATGETLGRCMNFFKEAAGDAGIVVSPYILQRKSRAPGTKRKAQASRREEKPAEKVVGHAGQSITPLTPPITMPAQASLLLSGLFQRLPKPGTVWPKEDRERWVTTLNNVLLLEYPEGEF
jgi:hypothetical protein